MQDNTYNEMQKLKENNLIMQKQLEQACKLINNLTDAVISLTKTVNDHDKELAGISATKKDLIDMNDPILERIIEEDYDKLWEGNKSMRDAINEGPEWSGIDDIKTDHVRYEEMEENQAKIIKLKGEDDE